MLAHRRSDPAIGGRMVRRPPRPKPATTTAPAIPPAASAPLADAPSSQLFQPAPLLPARRFRKPATACPPDGQLRDPGVLVEGLGSLSLSPPDVSGVARGAVAVRSEEKKTPEKMKPLLPAPSSPVCASLSSQQLPAEASPPPPCRGSVIELVPEAPTLAQLVPSVAALGVSVPAAEDATGGVGREEAPCELVQSRRFNASPPATIGASPSALPHGIGCCVSTAQTAPPESSLPGDADAVVGEGCEEAPWERVQSRRGMRRMAFSSPVLKTRPPPPAWLHGRCHRCHEAGHWAAICHAALRCNNCRQFGHKAKFCTGKTAPRPPPVKDRRAVRPRPWQRSPPQPEQQPQGLPCQPVDVQLQSVLAEQAELLRHELQGCLARVESFLVRAEAAFGRPPVAPDVSPPSDLHVGSVDDDEASLYGCFSPRATPSQSPQLVVPAASDREGISGVMTPVIKIMPELHELCGKAASLKVVPVGDEVVPSGELAPVPGALFAKKLCDFLVSLEADNPGSGKMIGCLLKERAIRSKFKKVGFGIMKEKSVKGKIKKSGASRKASPAA